MLTRQQYQDILDNKYLSVWQREFFAERLKRRTRMMVKAMDLNIQILGFNNSRLRKRDTREKHFPFRNY